MARFLGDVFQTGGFETVAGKDALSCSLSSLRRVSGILLVLVNRHVAPSIIYTDVCNMVHLCINCSS